MSVRASIELAELSEPAEVIRLDGREGLSELFDYEVRFVLDDPDFDVDALVWKSARVIFEDPEHGGSIQLQGIVEEADAEPALAQRFVYRVRLRPRLNGLAYRFRTRLFQDVDVKELVTKVFEDAGLPADSVEWKVSRSYPKRELCVQYQETELAFVRRLLEDEGIFFLFRHEDSGEVLVIGDSPDVLAAQGEVPVLPWLESGEGIGLSDTVVSSELRHDKYLARDWNFETPGGPVETEVERGGDGFIREEYPGGFLTAEDGLRRYQDRADAGRVEQTVLEGTSRLLALAPGGHFELSEVEPAALCIDYLVLTLQRSFESYTGEAAAPGAGAYLARVRAVPGTTPFRPSRRTPRPRIFGKESAVVTGPAGEEIHVDKYGRVKVHFYWDREGPLDDHSSCWVRVQQNQTSGSMLLPRVGWEVSVGFIDGDPDRPVVLQKLYNKETMPPYALPDNQTQMALQSSSSPGGGGTNEIRMQDGSGGMELFVHASKNMDVTVGNDLTEEVKVDSQAEVGLNLDVRVGADQTYNVGATHKLSITKEWTEETTGDKTTKIGALDDWGVKKNQTVTVEGAWKETIGAAMTVLANEVIENFNADCERKVGAAFSINSGTDFIEAVKGKKTEVVGGAKAELISKGKEEQIKAAKALQAGLLKTTSGKDITYSAKAALAVTVGGPWVEKCGEAFAVSGDVVKLTAPGGLMMKAGGTKLDAKGTSLKIKASSFGAKGQVQVQLKGKIDYKK